MLNNQYDFVMCDGQTSDFLGVGDILLQKHDISKRILLRIKIVSVITNKNAHIRIFFSRVRVLVTLLQAK